MGINVINSLKPQAFIWLVKVVRDTRTGSKTIFMNMAVQRNINAQVSIDKTIRVNEVVNRNIQNSFNLTKSIIK